MTMNRRDEGDDSVRRLVRAINATDPELRGAFTPEVAKRVLTEKQKEKKKIIIKEIELRRSDVADVVRLVKEDGYFRLQIGKREELDSKDWPDRCLTICKNELSAVKEALKDT